MSVSVWRCVPLANLRGCAGFAARRSIHRHVYYRQTCVVQSSNVCTNSNPTRNKEDVQICSVPWGCFLLMILQDLCSFGSGRTKVRSTWNHPDSLLFRAFSGFAPFAFIALASQPGELRICAASFDVWPAGLAEWSAVFPTSKSAYKTGESGNTRTARDIIFFPHNTSTI